MTMKWLLLWQTNKFEIGKKLRDAGFIGEQGWCECDTEQDALDKTNALMNLGVLAHQIKIIAPQAQAPSSQEFQYEALYTIDGVSAKIGGYKSIESLKEEMKAVIEMLLKRYGIPDGTYPVDVVICKAAVDVFIDHDEFSITVADKKVTDVEL